jgi:DNA-binding GntR family transcriptional regulator
MAPWPNFGRHQCAPGSTARFVRRAILDRVSARISQADLIYTQLRDRLTRGQVPVGHRLVEQQLAAEFKTSRTPVREALRRLEGDGHLTRDPSGGMRPRVPSVRAMRDLYDVRLAVEELVVRRAATAGNPGDLDELKQDWLAIAAEHRGGWLPDSGSAFVSRDESFHQRLAAASGNDFAVELLAEIADRIRILRIYDFTSDDRIGATIDEHLEIIAAVIAGDADTAASFMRAHVQRSANVVRERIGEALAKMFEEPAGV